MGVGNSKREAEKQIKNEMCPPTHSVPLSKEQNKIIIEQMEKKLCKIYMANGEFGSGFFCLIPFPDKINRLPVLFTNNHVLDENAIKNGETINLTLDDDKIEKKIIIDDKRKTYTSKELDTTIIELKPNDDGINSFLEIDYTLFESSTEEEKNYEDKDIYIIQYPGGGKCAFSTGKLTKINENDLTKIKR